jgi:hypothetical protein
MDYPWIHAMAFFYLSFSVSAFSQFSSSWNGLLSYENMLEWIDLFFRFVLDCVRGFIKKIEMLVFYPDISCVVIK